VLSEYEQSCHERSVEATTPTNISSQHRNNVTHFGIFKKIPVVLINVKSHA